MKFLQNNTVILFFTCVLIVILENLLLPAFIGPRPFLIFPLFILAIIVYGKNYTLNIFQAAIFVFIVESFSGISLGKMFIPLGITTGVYIWLNRFIDLRFGFKDDLSVSNILTATLIITFLGYVYSWFFIFFGSSYNFISVWDEWKILLISSLLYTFIWASIYSLIFKYVLEKK